jgi:hypothetical protein
VEPSSPEVALSGPVSITLVYQTHGGALRGTVEKCASRAVLLVPQDAAMRRPGFFRWAACDANDHYEIAAVRPGEYYALAFAGSAPIPAYDGLLKQASSVTVRAGETSSADLPAVK